MCERANITYVHEINQLLLFQLDSKTIYNLVMFAVRLRKDIRSYVRNELMQFLSSLPKKKIIAKRAWQWAAKIQYEWEISRQWFLSLYKESKK